MHGEVEYFSANSMYAASQAGVHAISPYVEALSAEGKWVRVIDDMGFPAGGPRTMTADLTGKLPPGNAEDSHHYEFAGLLGQHSGRSQQGSAAANHLQPAAQAREILRPAGKDAGLRNDANV
jgi:hypothetical protein